MNGPSSRAPYLAVCCAGAVDEALNQIEREGHGAPVEEVRLVGDDRAEEDEEQVVVEPEDFELGATHLGGGR